MCGIAGILDWNAPPDLRALGLMTDALVHRGPDAGAVTDIGVAALGHRRLAIIQLGHFTFCSSIFTDFAGYD